MFPRTGFFYTQSFSKITILGAVLLSMASFLSCAFSQEKFNQLNIHGNKILIDDKYKGGVIFPAEFKVWIGKDFVVNQPAPGTKQAILPTNNDNEKRPSCYVACYSRELRHSVYGGQKFFGDNIFVMSQVRVPGRYISKGTASICTPEGFETADISKELFFSHLCETKFPKACRDGKCWAGGETDWFGVGR